MTCRLLDPKESAFREIVLPERLVIAHLTTPEAATTATVYRLASRRPTGAPTPSWRASSSP
jgi:hypothetical protein